MLALLMNFLSACWCPSGYSSSDSDAFGRHEGLLWYKDYGQHVNGDFSMAVAQANSLLEDHSQIESGSLSLLDSGPFGTFVGIYDGHGGTETARYITDNVFYHIKRFTAEQQSMSADVIRKAIQATEEGFLSLVSKQWPLKPQIAAVGSCCLVGVVCNGTLYIANLGDSRAVLGKLVKATGEILALQLSTEHNASIESVRQELQSLHPDDPQIVVLKHNVWRVKGIIQVSRAIGDVYLKRAEFNREPLYAKFLLPEPFQKPILSAEPSIYVQKLSPEDQFILFASDGLWEHLSNQDAVDIIRKYPRNGIARRIIKVALQKAAKKREMRYSDLMKIDRGVRRHFHDDIAVIVLFLDANLVSRASTSNGPTLSLRGGENSSKFIQAITWNRSSSSSRSYSISSHKDISLTEGRNELFDDYGGMGSGSHSQTIGRLYAWEKKLYEEVKVGEQTRQMYQRKCLQLRNHDTKGSGSRTVDKSRVAAKELYARIWVSLRTIETISLRIQKVRDEELHPQLIELLQGLMRTWRIMLQSHEKQNQIMFDVKTFTCPSYGRYCSDSQRQVTRKLEQQLEHWGSCFTTYVAAQRAYVEALGGWLSKCFAPEMKLYCRTISSAPSYKEGSPPPLLLILQEWLRSLMKLPDCAVSLSMKGFIDNMKVLLVKQGDEQQQKSKVDGLAKEFDHRVAVLQKAEDMILESMLSDMKPEAEVRDRVDCSAGRKDLLDMFRQKLETEKAKHQNCMQETTQATLNGFKAGLAKVFESLTEFSRDSLNLYAELLARNDAAAEKPSCIEDSKVEVDKG